MSKIHCIVVDDEPHALELIKSYVLQTPFLEFKAGFNNASEALICIEEQPIDLCFLDIQMPSLSGMSLSKMLDENQRVIFTTAFEKYALEGYKVNALDYLLKPVSYDEFYQAALRAKTAFDSIHAPTEIEVSPKHVLVKADYKVHQINLEDILFFEGVKDYVRIHRKSTDKVLMPLMSLKYLEAKLAAANFMRVHRSYLVNLNSISVIERNQIVFGTHRITVSDKYKATFTNFMSTRFL